MPSPTLSETIKKANSSNADVAALSDKLNTSLSLDEGPTDPSSNPSPDADSGDDWEKLADEDTEVPAEPVKKTAPPIQDSSILELYEFDTRLAMHQLVKEFTKIVDSTGTMPFRPKMVNQSLLMTFNNPKHGMRILLLG